MNEISLQNSRSSEGEPANGTAGRHPRFLRRQDYLILALGAVLGLVFACATMVWIHTV